MLLSLSRSRALSLSLSSFFQVTEELTALHKPSGLSLAQTRPVMSYPSRPGECLWLSLLLLHPPRPPARATCSCSPGEDPVAGGGSVREWSVSPKMESLLEKANEAPRKTTLLHHPHTRNLRHTLDCDHPPNFQPFGYEVFVA